MLWNYKYMYLEFMHVTTDTYGLEDNCLEFLDVGRGSLQGVLSIPDNCIGCEEWQVLAVLYSLPRLFLRVVFAASNLEEWGNTSYREKQHSSSESHRFPKLTTLSCNTNPRVQPPHEPLHMAPGDSGWRELMWTWSSVCMLSVRNEVLVSDRSWFWVCSRITSMKLWQAKFLACK